MILVYNFFLSDFFHWIFFSANVSRSMHLNGLKLELWSQVYSITECRSLVKTLVCGVKTITWSCAACKTPLDSTTTTATVSGKNLQPKETVIFIRLVQWAMKALDIYAINVPGVSELNINSGPGSACATFPATTASSRQASPPQTIRSKEEKEVLEHFAGVFAMMNPQTFKEVFATTIDYVVERIYRNSALQVHSHFRIYGHTTFCNLDLIVWYSWFCFFSSTWYS